MTLRITELSPTELSPAEPSGSGGGLGCLRTERGNLPLERLAVNAAVIGLTARTVVTQRFHNPHPVAIEATYVFPLPDRGAVTAMRMTAADRVIEAELRERGDAREAYDQALAEGRRAAMAEQERADVFTMRVGTIMPGERVSVELTVVGPLAYADGEATYRFPLVVAPRYIPGTPVPAGATGTGYAPDTDAVPDASRITPPVLLPGFPNPVALSIDVQIDPDGLPLGEVRSSLHAVQREGNRVSIEPGERLDRDLILRFDYGRADSAASVLTLTPDADGDEGTFRLTVLPPTSAAPSRPRDVVLLLDRSGSMQGWKMVAARRAAARIVDTLGDRDRFAVLTFDHAVEGPEGLGDELVAATDRHRFEAVRHLAGVTARGGTELYEPLHRAIGLLAAAGDEPRDRVVVLVTDGQVGNEDQIIAETAKGLAGIRVHTVGVDRAVNAGFLGRLAAVGGGRCELVESEDRLDVAMERIHRRIASPVVSGLSWTPTGLDVVAGTVTPARPPDLFSGAPLVLAGRYTRAGADAAIRIDGRTVDGGDAWQADAAAHPSADQCLTQTWARAYLGDLEDRYAAEPADAAGLERLIIQTSLRFGVLCRFTAWLAIDTRVVNEGGQLHRIAQPVEQPSGWDMRLEEEVAAPMMMRAALSMPMPPAPAVQRSTAPVIAVPKIGAPARPKPLVGRGSAARVGALAAPRVDARRAGEQSALSQVSEQIAAELTRLTEAADQPAGQRREVLVDLGSRLAAALRFLADRGIAGPATRLLRDVVALLREDSVLALDRDGLGALWLRVIAALETFAGQKSA